MRQRDRGHLDTRSSTAHRSHTWFRPDSTNTAPGEHRRAEQNSPCRDNTGGNVKSGPTSTTRHQNLPAGPVPKHVQLREILRELVLSGQFPGGQLPSERVLADRYGVSRITVRTAIEQLIADGHVIRIRGRGTFTTQAVGRAQLCSVTERAAQQGVHLQTKVLGTAETTPPATIAEALGLADGQPAYQVRRLRIADGVPMAVESGWYPRTSCQDCSTTTSPVRSTVCSTRCTECSWSAAPRPWPRNAPAPRRASCSTSNREAPCWWCTGSPGPRSAPSRTPLPGAGTTSTR
jgi:DNA-binding transcriptional regulator YhcF (GntR family)